MARYIDADLLMKEFCDFVRPSNNSDFAPVPNWNDAVSLVGSAPTADVAPVVRCKDCKLYDLQDLSNPKHNTDWCVLNGFNPQNNDYCSYGERREGG